MFSLGLGPRIYLSPQSEDASGGGYPERTASEQSARALNQRTFSHSRALPLEEALEVLMVECLRTYISSLPEPGLVPDFCLRHETLRAYIRNQPGFDKITAQNSASNLQPLALLGALSSPAVDEPKKPRLLEALKSSLRQLSFQPPPAQSNKAQEAPEELESVIAEKIEKAFTALFRRFWRPKKEENSEDEVFARWFDVAALHSLCTAIETELEKPNNVSCRLVGKSNQFEMVNALSEEHSLPCAEYLVDRAVAAILSSQDSDWINCQHVRVINPENESERSLSDTVYDAVTSAWEARRCVCQELVMMSAQDFFDRFPGFADLEEGVLGNVHVAILPCLEREASARLYVFKLSEGKMGLSDSVIRDLEWVAFKCVNALRRIETRARDEA